MPPIDPWIDVDRVETFAESLQRLVPRAVRLGRSLDTGRGMLASER